MKAITYRRYGSPDVLQLEDVAKPVPRADEVLVRVRAVSLNAADWHYVRGDPSFIRIVTGLKKPRDGRLGIDVAGVVEAVGADVKELEPGAAVFGTCRGSVAEYVCVAVGKVARKPENVTFEEASTAGVAAFTALQGLRDKGRVRAGQKVLVNGAAGGVGTYAVQIAKWLGAEVTGVCSTRNVGLVQSIGADRVVDYTRDDFTTGAERYDVILDCAGTRTMRESRRVMKAKAIHVGIGAPRDINMRNVFAGLIASLFVSLFTSHKFVTMVAKSKKDDLATIRDLLASGAVKPVIEKVYPFAEAADAMRHLETGHVQGKIVVAVG